MNNINIVKAKNKIIGEYFAFSCNSAKPFKNNMTECRSVTLRNTDIVADIGSYIGEYSMYCSTKNVKQILSYEPTPRTFGVLRKNLRKPMEIFNVAIVGDDRKFARLYLSKRIGVTNSIAKTVCKAGHIDVKALRYEDAVKNATVVKIDVEGAEYSFNIIQPQIRAIILEFHPVVGIGWKGRALRIMDEIESNGYKCIMRPTFKSGWSLTGSWEK